MIEGYTKQYNCLKEFKLMKESDMFNPGWDIEHSITTMDPNEIKQDLIVAKEINEEAAKNFTYEGIISKENYKYLGFSDTQNQMTIVEA